MDASQNVAHLLLSNTEPAGDFALKHLAAKGSNFCDLLFGQFAAPVVGAFSLPALGNHIRYILVIRSEKEVFGIYTPTIVTAMQNAKADGDRTFVDFP